MMHQLPQLYSQPWHILYSAWLMLDSHVQEATSAPVPESDPPMAARPKKNILGDAIPQMEMRGPVAVIPVHGPLVKGASGSQKFRYGVIDYQDVHADLNTLHDQGAKAAVLWVKSPGGTVLGAAGLADRVSALARVMPVASYTEDMQCSAAEYITGGCTARFATPDAIVGSIGTIAETVSVEGMLKKFGIAWNVFTSGPYKGLGHPAKDMKQEQADWLQAHVNARAAEFKAHMTAHRPLKPDVMQGQIFTGSEAAKNGLLDATVSGLDEVLAFLS